ISSLVSSLNNELTRLEIRFSYNQSTGILGFMGKRWLCKSMENYEVLRGIEVGEIWLDEAAFMKKEAYDVIIGRLRDKSGGLEVLLTTSPNGFNFIYDYFVGEYKTSDHLIIRATSETNRHLPQGYLDTLKTQYSEKQLRQELGGEFISLTTGQVYYAFDPMKHIKKTYQQNGTIYIGMDFNTAVMTAVIIQQQNDKLVIIDEVYDLNSDTFKMAHILKKKGYSGCNIIPDSTGANRKTSGQSDHLILRQAGFLVVRTHNPRVYDRVNNVNRLLSNNTIVIGDNCPKVTNDLNQVSWRNGELDQTGKSSLLTHISDSLGYVAWKLMPLIDRRKTTSIQL
ncbi:MAG: phage terminase large subunit, partial [Thiotrichaceae bacterium]|nr:phage terminase large subunit [Thiotrichaceae bacterium]